VDRRGEKATGGAIQRESSILPGRALTEACQPDVLVVDLGMPEMDGLQFITRIRSSDDPAVRDIPAAALTAFARSDDRTKALQSGFEIHLAKPVDPGELVASVATLVRRRTLGGKTESS
jgi:CheY-like chemotaxis protein